jgi:hypothetical protein
MKRILLSLVAVAAVSQASAAEWGVGIGVGQNAGGIYVPVALSADVRVEPFVRYNESNFAASGVSSSQNSLLVMGLGLFYARPLSEGLTAYLGGRFGYAKSRTNDRYVAGVDPVTGVEQSQARTNNYKGFQLGPTVGVDYRFHKNLSLGGEVGLSYTKGKSSGQASYVYGPNLNGPVNSTSKDTTTLLLIKYHFQ